MNDFTVLNVLVSLLSAGIGAYLGAYLKRKGENYATKEDIEFLNRQLAATTRIAESIKTEISAEYWLAQERWKLRRDLYQGILINLLEVEEGFRQLGVMLRSEDAMRRFNENPDEQRELKAVWTKIANEQYKATAAARLVSEKAATIIDALEADTNGTLDMDRSDESVERIIQSLQRAGRELVAASREDLLLGVGARDA